MRILLVSLLSVPFLAFGQKKDKANCLIALSKIDFPKNSLPATISPVAGYRWQWDGKEISLLSTPEKKNGPAEPVWSVEKYKENSNGRIPMKSKGNAEMIKEHLEKLQSQFLELSFLTLLRTEPTDKNAIDLDKIYSECEGVSDITPAKAHFGKKPIVSKKSIGELSRANRDKIRAQFPNIFKTSPAAGSNNSGVN